METFIEALVKNDILTLEQLVSEVNDCDKTDAEGKTAFLIAAQYAHCATLKWLVQHGVDYKKTDYFERSALYATLGWQAAITTFDELIEALHQQPLAIYRKALIKVCTQLTDNSHRQVVKIQALNSHLYYTNNLFERCLLELYVTYHTAMEKCVGNCGESFIKKRYSFPYLDRKNC